MLSVSVSVECGVWTVDYDSAVSGEPPPAPVAGAMLENATVFLSYEGIQNIIRHISHRPPQEKLPLHHLTLAAAGAGAITSFLL